MKILAVDDSPDSMLLIKRILHQAGYTEVLDAASAEEAFVILGLHNPAKTENVDLILMNVVMPGMDGIESSRRIKSKKHLQDIPLIILTANAEEKTLEAAFDAGAMDYITKSSNKTVLLARVRSALSLKKERDQRKAREKELLETTRLLEKANRKLQEQSFQDGLTGIANRRRFDGYLKAEWSRAERNFSPLSLIMADIDQFKSYNDHYGHLAGDDCLIKVAHLLKHTLKRPADMAARYGGEEFAVLLPETDAKGAEVLAEELRRKIEKSQIPHACSSIHNYVTISLGVSTVLPAEGFSSKHLLESADKALYRAKQKGRNRVEVFIPTTSDN